MNDVKIYGNPTADLTIIRLLGEHEYNIDDEIKLLSKREGDNEWCMLTVQVSNWEHEMSPWVTNVNYKVVPDEIPAYIDSGARVKLNSIIDEVMPDYESEYPNANRKYIIAGYSLAGLFSLWASYQTDKFYGVMAASPSVWYEGWMEYIKENVCKAKVAYLSLGNKEHKTRHPLMAKVADNIKEQKMILINQGIDTFYEENQGNHFKDVTERMVKGIAYLIEKIK